MTDDVGDENIMCEPLLYMYVETLMDEDDFEIDTGSCDGLQSVEQEDPPLRNERKLEAWERPRTSGEKQVDGRLLHEWTVVMATKEAALFDHGHVGIDSTPVEKLDYVPVTA